jgi:prevent-host-death family protein
MKMAKLSDAKNRLSYYVERVRRGERVRILVRGRPAADLVPVNTGTEENPDDAAVLAAAERQGLLRRGEGGVPAELLGRRKRARGRAISQLLLEERRSGR